MEVSKLENEGANQQVLSGSTHFEAELDRLIGQTATARIPPCPIDVSEPLQPDDGETAYIVKKNAPKMLYRELYFAKGVLVAKAWAFAKRVVPIYKTLDWGWAAGDISADGKFPVSVPDDNEIYTSLIELINHLSIDNEVMCAASGGLEVSIRKGYIEDDETVDVKCEMRLNIEDVECYSAESIKGETQ